MAARDEAAAGGSAQASAPAKKKRNLPGNPNPDAEVIALSPKTLMATNRFVCEVCSKGFQREQNLQLHRRGHNLPWKLKQKSGKEARRRVYLCPEPTCVHHDPSRALGDLTGIKKHFCRKHGEKKWKCDKCSKRYAVQSDWKAHSKTCGTREYRCDCGTLFSRRDSFITHRAFCDALAHESSRMPGSHLYGGGSIGLGLAQLNPHLTAIHNPSGLPSCMDALISPSHPSAFRSPPSAAFFLSPPASNPDFGNEFGSDLFNAGSDQTTPHMMMMNHHFYNQAGCSMHSLLDASAPSDSVLPQMSATALLQKAAQMGATSSNNSRNETHLQDIMNSFANGNSGIFSGGQQQEAKFGDFNVGFCGLDESNYHGNGLTRDFLGVGSLLRNLGGGVSSQREQQQNHGVVDVTESLNSEMKPASLCHSFAGGSRLR